MRIGYLTKKRDTEYTIDLSVNIDTSWMSRRRSSGQQNETIASGKAHTEGRTKTLLLRVCSEGESSLKNEPNFLLYFILYYSFVLFYFILSVATVDVLRVELPPFAILSNGIEQGRNFQVSPNLNQLKSMTHWIPSCRRLGLHMLFALGRRAVRFMRLMSDHLEGVFFSFLPTSPAWNFCIVSL